MFPDILALLLTSCSEVSNVDTVTFPPNSKFGLPETLRLTDLDALIFVLSSKLTSFRVTLFFFGFDLVTVITFSPG